MSPPGDGGGVSHLHFCGGPGYCPKEIETRYSEEGVGPGHGNQICNPVYQEEGYKSWPDLDPWAIPGGQGARPMEAHFPKAVGTGQASNMKVALAVGRCKNNEIA